MASSFCSHVCVYQSVWVWRVMCVHVLGDAVANADR
jgi:hypothetical protein